jgi:monoamine oxidase
VRCDVAIVGGGISGLACAAALSCHGIPSVIFEARGVIGGRVRTYRPPDGGPALELGAQVIHGSRNPLRDLGAHAVPATGSPASHPVPRDIAARAVLHGKITPLGLLARGGVPPWAVEQRLIADGCLVNGRASGHPASGHPGNGHPASGQPADRHQQDDLPVASWLETQPVSGGHLRAAAEWFRQNWAADPQALSARGVATAYRGADSGDGEFAFSHGFGALAEALAAGLDVRLRTPVRTLIWAPGRVEVTTGDGTRSSARAVVITAPPPVITGGRLDITPMPEQKAAAASALPAGDGLCAVATLRRPAPESAFVFDADGQAGFVRCQAGRPEVLVVAKAAAAAAVRTADLAGLVRRMFPRWTDAEVIGVQVADWGRDPWSAGVFSYPAVGAGWAGAAWAAPVRQTLFFAGEATTTGALPPSVHGAFYSGLRAASDVVEAWGR